MNPKADWFQEAQNAVILHVKLIPRAKQNEIVGIEGDALKIRLNAPPVQGRANEALVQFLADILDIPRANVEIVHGAASRHKVLRLHGVSAQELERLTK
jgi:uncharacterized protein